MSDVYSYPVPIRDVIIGGKTWGDCALAKAFRKSRLKVVPDSPIVGYIPNLSQNGPQYSQKIESIRKLFLEAKEAGWSSLYFFSKTEKSADASYIEDSVFFKTLTDYWSPQQLDKHLDMFDPDRQHQTLIAFDLYGDFDSQIRSGKINPAIFTNWSELTNAPIDCVKEKVLFLTAQQKQKAEQAKERRFKTVWVNPETDRLPPKIGKPNFRLEALT